MTAAYPKHGHSRGKQGLHYQLWAAKRPLTSQHNSTVLLCFYPTHLSPSVSRARWGNSSMTTANEGMRVPHIPATASTPTFLPKGSGPRRTAALEASCISGEGLQSQACLGQLGALSAQVPSQTLSSHSHRGVRWPPGGRAEAPTEPSRQGKAKRRF